MGCLHRIPVSVIKAYADCLIQNICLSIMIIEFMHLHHRLKYGQMPKLPSAHKHGHCQTLHILTLNKTRVLPGLERHDPQACKRRKYTRGQVKYISICTTRKCSEKNHFCINRSPLQSLSCSCVFSLLTGSGVRPDLMTRLNHL